MLRAFVSPWLVSNRRNSARALGGLRNARGEFEGERRDSRRSLLVDLVPVVGWPVIVGVESGKEINRRHSRVKEGRVVASPCARSRLFDFEPPGRLCGRHEVGLQVAGVEPADVHGPACSTDHIEVQHRDRIRE